LLQAFQTSSPVAPINRDEMTKFVLEHYKPTEDYGRSGLERLATLLDLETGFNWNCAAGRRRKFSVEIGQNLPDLMCSVDCTDTDTRVYVWQA